MILDKVLCFFLSFNFCPSSRSTVQDLGGSLNASLMGQQILNQYEAVHPASSWDDDWTTAIFLYGALKFSKSHTTISAEKFFEKIAKNNRQITMPDLAAMSLPAIQLKADNQSAQASKNKIVADTEKYLETEELNKIGAYDHVGKRHRFASWLPKTSLFVPSSIWVDSLMMYVLNGLNIYEERNDQNKIDFFVGQFLIFHKYLFDEKAHLYKHAYSVDSGELFPQENYWARGNAWVDVALVDALENLPKKHPNYEVLQKILNQHLKSMLTYFDENKGFKTLLDSHSSSNYYESSSSALYIYALSKALRLGLSDATSRDQVQKMRSSLYQYLFKVSDDRLSVGQISGPTTALKYSWYYTDIVGLRSDESYGVGAYLLMLSEEL